MLRIGLLLLCGLILTACVNQSILPDFADEQQSIAKAQQLFERYQQFQQNKTELAWPDISAQSHQEALAFYNELLAELIALPDQALNASTYLDKQTLLQQLQFTISQHEHFSYTLFDPHSNLWPSQAVQQLLLEHSIHSIADAQSYLHRLSSLPLLLQQWQQHYQQTPIAYPQALSQALLQELQDFNLTAVEESILWQDFSRKVEQLNIYANTHQLLLKKAQRILQRQVAPAYRQLLAELEKNTNTDLVFLSQENGQHYYQQLLSIYAGSTLGALQIHELAQAEVQRLQQLIAGQKNSTINIDLATAVTSGNLRASANLAYVPQTPLVLSAQSFSNNGNQHLLPHYRGSDQEGHNPAIYYYIKQPSYSLMEHAEHNSLAMLHAQQALVQEQSQRPNFIRFGKLASRTNAWNLYSQQLAPLNQEQQLGAWLNELQLASQAVLDTGLHALGWSTQQSQTYLTTHTPFNVARQQRMLVQALAQPAHSSGTFMQLQQLRQLVQQAHKHQGKRFNLAQLHSDYLAQGSLFTEHYPLWLDFWLHNN